ncbi:MAG: DUF3825 domain-containing protein [Atopobiaceae bacterium]|jgi:hypothetical protein|nr:DUF3825 domain-containing protein [Atopobiaceae bacterium]MCH4119068.1 DUF3825 domain-containing protein [Atopobiaceae bacterium]MCI1389791.1 DUF3825 domain-containing protein [Atopobiaceae bacterium]MCI1432173.1 DUF3825 domain-containing protein [Atopobiaceae bacterium]MCI1470631.1 DUF3825 domain-containing protein [Atopobiaceae bacterium]
MAEDSDVTRDEAAPAGGEAQRRPAERELPDLWSWAFLAGWEDALDGLAAKALPERWDFASPEGAGNGSGNGSGGGRRNTILANYLRYTFCRLEHEGKVREDAEAGLASFDTGLVDQSYEPIYACFNRNRRPGAQPWFLAGFFRAGEDSMGDRIVRAFNPLPQRARYLTRLDQVLYDVDQTPHLDFDHILLDNVERLPRQLLERELGDSEQAMALVHAAWGSASTIGHADAHASATEEALDSLRELLTDDRTRRLRLKNALSNACDLAVERVKWSYRTAVPAYYPRFDAVNLLLPLELTEDAQPDTALVVEHTASGAYIGQTILTPQMAYMNARLICRPEVEWLNEALG